MDFCDVAIVGAGPFGLSAAAHLRQIRGLDQRIFGRPMQFWEQCMPPQMLLRSHWHATHIDDPEGELSLDSFVSNTHRYGLNEPIPVREFIRYGQWFHDTAGIKADPRKVTRIDPTGIGYELALEDGPSIRAKRVIVAAGIEPFAYKPETFRHVPAELVSHSSELRDYQGFRDKDVLVVGGGQSSLESAAFLKQGGARVEILVRAPMRCRRKSLLRRMIDPKWLKPLHGRGGVGPAGISLIIQRPSLFGRLPRKTQEAWSRRATKLGFSYRLVPDMNETPICSGQAIERASVQGQQISVKLTTWSWAPAIV
jgi:FAD-dependent urate hydroxylase